MIPTPQWPSEDEGRQLHAALLTHTVTAPNDFASTFYAPLCVYLAHRYPYVSEDLRANVACDVILKLVQQPEQYNPALLPVCAYLRMAVRRKLCTASEKESRRRRREIPLELVEEPIVGGNRWLNADEPSWDDPRLTPEIAAFAPVERTALALLRQGVRSTNAFAQALGLDPTRPDLALIVKRIKDTVKVRLRRAVGGRS